MRCDIIAQGIINASKQLDLKIPVVVRLQVIVFETCLSISISIFEKLISFSVQGTNVKEAKALIADSKIKVFSVDDFAGAAETAVKLALMMNLAKSLDLDISITAKSPSKKVADCTKEKK